MIKNLFAITFLSLSLSFISNISFAQNIQQQSTEIQQLINNKPCKNNNFAFLLFSGFDNK